MKPAADPRPTRPKTAKNRNNARRVNRFLSEKQPQKA